MKLSKFYEPNYKEEKEYIEAENPKFVCLKCIALYEERPFTCRCRSNVFLKPIEELENETSTL